MYKLVPSRSRLSLALPDIAQYIVLLNAHFTYRIVENMNLWLSNLGESCIGAATLKAQKICETKVAQLKYGLCQ